MIYGLGWSSPPLRTVEVPEPEQEPLTVPEPERWPQETEPERWPQETEQPDPVPVGAP